MYYNEHRVIDELHCLRIVRVSHLPYCPDINPCDFWIFGDFKEKLKHRHSQDSEEILKVIQELWDNVTFEDNQKIFESLRDRLS
jgi:hypothetical protein